MRIRNALTLEYYQDVGLPFEYANQVLDKNQTGSTIIDQILNDSKILNRLPIPKSLILTNDTKSITDTLIKEFGDNHTISIDEQLKPSLIKSYENITAYNTLKCDHAECPYWWKSHSELPSTLSTIGNVSNSTSILILNGENDSNTSPTSNSIAPKTQ